MPCAKLVVAPGRALILSVAWRRRKGIHSRSLSENYNTKAGLGNRDDADRPDCDRRGAPGAGFAPKRPGRAQKQPRSAMTFLENRDPLFSDHASARGAGFLAPGGPDIGGSLRGDLGGAPEPAAGLVSRQGAPRRRLTPLRDLEHVPALAAQVRLVVAQALNDPREIGNLMRAKPQGIGCAGPALLLHGRLSRSGGRGRDSESQAHCNRSHSRSPTAPGGEALQMRSFEASELRINDTCHCVTDP